MWQQQMKGGAQRVPPQNLSCKFDQLPSVITWLLPPPLQVSERLFM
jgi:hypothetical protein